MAIQTWYFDSVGGSDSNGGHSPSDALQNYTSFNTGLTGLGDILLFKRGTTQTITAVGGKSVRSGSSDTVRAKYGAYGTASVPYATFKYGAASGNIILTAGGSKYIDFEDLYFDMAGTDCRTAIYLASQGSTQTIGHNIRRCFFTGSNIPTTGGGTGLNVLRENTSTVAPANYVIEDCEFFDNGEHGLFLRGCSNMIVRRCKFHGNGAYSPTGGHGFSSGTNNTSVTSGWTLVSGTVYSRALGTAELAVYYVRGDTSGYGRIRQTSGTQSTPGLGEFGYTAGSPGTLYLNIGASPNSKTIIYVWGKCGGLTIEDCESHDNIWNRSALFHEGHGFAFDDWADDSIFQRNRSWNNEGAGFSINRGDRCTVFANIAYSNGQAGVVGSPCDTLKVYNNTLYGNNTSTEPYPGEVSTNGNCANWIITNNILLATRSSYGISRETTDSGFSGTLNGIYGYSVAAEKNASVTGTVNVTPALDANYRPAATQLIRAGTYLGGKDFNNKHFYNPPNIGAVDDITATPRFALRTS